METINNFREPLIIDDIALSNRLALLRNRASLTQRTLSQKLGISHSHIAQLETGRKRLTLDVLMLYVNFFHVSVDYILFGTNMEEIDTTMVKNISPSSSSASFKANFEPDTLDAIKIGRNLFILRSMIKVEKDCPLTQKALVEQLRRMGASIHQQDISKHETGSTLPSLSTLNAYHNYFGISIDEILYTSFIL